MTIGELHKLIVGCGIGDGIGWYYIGGCDVLGRVSDVPGFVSLLGSFRRLGDADDVNVSFVDDYPDPIVGILGGGVKFVAAQRWVDIYVDVGFGVECDYRCLL
jgi:hypothetical protein